MEDSPVLSRSLKVPFYHSSKSPKSRKKRSVVKLGLSRSAHDLSQSEDFCVPDSVENGDNAVDYNRGTVHENSQSASARMEQVKVQSHHSIFGFLKRKGPIRSEDFDDETDTRLLTAPNGSKSNVALDSSKIWDWSRLHRHNREHQNQHLTDSSSAEPTPRSTPSSSPQFQRLVSFSRRKYESNGQQSKRLSPALEVSINKPSEETIQNLAFCQSAKLVESLDSLEDFGDRQVEHCPEKKEEFIKKEEYLIENLGPPTESNPLNIQQEIERVEREMERIKYELFDLKVTLVRARNLPAKDACGTSDPYVKFKHKNRLLYKSSTVYKNLNPVWQDTFTALVDDSYSPLYVKVFDYDWGIQDDFLGSGYVDLTSIEFNKPTDITLSLRETQNGPCKGEVDLIITMTPKTVEEHEKQLCRQRTVDQNKKLKSQIWSAVVTVVLVEGYNCTTKDGGTPGRPYVRFKLGQEKWKSKATQRTANPSWREQFDFHFFEDQPLLEVVYCDKESRNRDETVGKFIIDLSTLERETTHRIRQNVIVEQADGTISDVVGTLFLLLTISGSTSAESVSDMTSPEVNPCEKIAIINSRYGVLRTFQNLRDVGYLTVKVFRARGLAAADIGGTSDPFCVLELDNARLQTQTEYRTLTPNWYKVFTFQVKDINSALEVTVYDEDRSRRSDFLGKVVIPLLRINNSERRWYNLKDRTLRTVARGNNPQILLEMSVYWNPLRGAIRTLQPKERKYIEANEGFSRTVFMRNVMRLKALGKEIYSIVLFFESCLEWESPIRSLTAFVTFLVGTFYFEPYMVPLALLPLFMKSYVAGESSGADLEKMMNWSWIVAPNMTMKIFQVNLVSTGKAAGCRETDFSDVSGGSAGEEDDEKEEKKSLKMRVQAIQEVTQTVQNSIGYIASVGEQLKNAFNFTVPFLSWLAVFLLLAASLLLYLIHVRWIVMFWGILKFTRKVLRPTSVPNNELLDFLSRVPDKEFLIQSREVFCENHTPPIVRKRRDAKAKK